MFFYNYIFYTLIISLIAVTLFFLRSIFLHYTLVKKKYSKDEIERLRDEVFRNSLSDVQQHELKLVKSSWVYSFIALIIFLFFLSVAAVYTEDLSKNILEQSKR